MTSSALVMQRRLERQFCTIVQLLKSSSDRSVNAGGVFSKVAVGNKAEAALGLLHNLSTHLKRLYCIT